MDGGLRGAIDLMMIRPAAAGVAAAARRTAIAALPAAVAAFCAAAAIGCGVAALWIAAIPLLGPAGAALCAATLLAVLSLGVLLLARRLAKPVSPPAPLPALPADALVVEVQRLFRDNKATMLAAALFGGLCAGADTGGHRR